MSTTYTWRNVDSRSLTEPLTDIACAIDDIAWFVQASLPEDDEVRAEVLAHLIVIRKAQKTMCDLAFNPQPPL